jgi:carboxypeptidase family protein
MTVASLVLRTATAYCSVLFLSVAGHQDRTQSRNVAVVTGKVVSDDTAQVPLRHAIVTITGSALSESRSAITDDDGAFSFRNLPPGRVILRASKPGYLSSAFGATRAGRAGISTLLSEGSELKALIALQRGAVLSGAIFDENGQPLEGVRVFAVSLEDGLARGLDSLVLHDGSGAGVLTDDRGMYRLFGLAPGNYLIAALTTLGSRNSTIPNEITSPSIAQIDAIFQELRRGTDNIRPAIESRRSLTPSASVATTSLAPVFFPGTSDVADAQRLSLSAGDVRLGLDLRLRLVPVTAISGRVISSEGPMPTSVRLSIARANAVRFVGFANADPVLVQAVGRDGVFRFENVLPGHYTIRARAAQAVNSLSRTYYAAEEIYVDGRNDPALSLFLEPGVQVSGKLKIDTASRLPFDITQVRLEMVPVSGAGSAVVNGTTFGGSAISAPPAVQAKPDGTFVFSDVEPGSYLVRCRLPREAAGSWWVRSAMLGARDVLDSELRVPRGSDVTSLTVTITERRNILSGSLHTAANVPASEYTVIAFSPDPSHWGPSSRRIRAANPAADGAFSFDLPAGEYVLAVVTDLAGHELRDPVFLASLIPSGVRLVLNDGDHKTQALQIR